VGTARGGFPQAAGSGYEPQATGHAPPTPFPASPHRGRPAGRDPGPMQPTTPRVRLLATHPPRATSYELQAAAHEPPSKTPTPALPKGEGAYFALHRPQARSFWVLPLGAGGRRPEGVVCREVGSGEWEVGGGLGHASTLDVRLFSVPKTPTPALPQGEGALFDAKHELEALGWLRTKPTSYGPQATGHGLLFFASPCGGGGRRPEGGCLERCVVRGAWWVAMGL